MASGEKRGDLGKVVVIGGNGFLGHHIVNQAISSWNTTSVTSIDLRCVRNVNNEAEYHECDITDKQRLAELIQKIKPDVVIHTASPAISGDFKVANELFRKVNVDGTQSVIEACQSAGVKALVYTSSASVISDNENSLFNADENWPVIRGAQQNEYYSETKVYLSFKMSMLENPIDTAIYIGRCRRTRPQGQPPRTLQAPHNLYSPRRHLWRRRRPDPRRLPPRLSYRQVQHPSW